jgi:hypothetical protein
VLTRNLPAGQNTNLLAWLKAHESIGAAVSVSPSRGMPGLARIWRMKPLSIRLVESF